MFTFRYYQPHVAQSPSCKGKIIRILRFMRKLVNNFLYSPKAFMHFFWNLKLIKQINVTRNAGRKKLVEVKATLMRRTFTDAPGKPPTLGISFGISLFQWRLQITLHGECKETLSHGLKDFISYGLLASYLSRIHRCKYESLIAKPLTWLSPCYPQALQFTFANNLALLNQDAYHVFSNLSCLFAA